MITGQTPCADEDYMIQSEAAEQLLTDTDAEIDLSKYIHRLNYLNHSKKATTLYVVLENSAKIKIK